MQQGDSVPHFQVQTVSAEPFSYSSIWQRKNLVLVAVPSAEAEAPGTYVARLLARGAEFASRDAVCVVTKERVPGIQSPSVVVADRWGEAVHVVTASRVDELPSLDELLDWLDYVNMRCPECEGESR